MESDKDAAQGAARSSEAEMGKLHATGGQPAVERGCAGLRRLRWQSFRNCASISRTSAKFSGVPPAGWE